MGIFFAGTRPNGSHGMDVLIILIISLSYIMGLFGWVANSQPGSRKPPLCCLFACLESQARLQEATHHPLARLHKNIASSRFFLGVRLGLAHVPVLLTS
jgi:hypothetical protein